eukprot:TRINITY_DN8970_c0_g1_i1.p1 TRINITY_DN8970_c0_g1~~TRINITY_DN8970_c0_g1_i1.p1  ORF type:complete len:1054 (+),score=145.75 TRINITY_DN8970_c0_g1_i1:47-3208(+)
MQGRTGACSLALASCVMDRVDRPSLRRGDDAAASVDGSHGASVSIHDDASYYTLQASAVDAEGSTTSSLTSGLHTAASSSPHRAAWPLTRPSFTQPIKRAPVSAATRSRTAPLHSMYPIPMHDCHAPPSDASSSSAPTPTPPPAYVKTTVPSRDVNHHPQPPHQPPRWRPPGHSPMETSTPVSQMSRGTIRRPSQSADGHILKRVCSSEDGADPQRRYEHRGYPSPCPYDSTGSAQEAGWGRHHQYHQQHQHAPPMGSHEGRQGVWVFVEHPQDLHDAAPFDDPRCGSELPLPPRRASSSSPPPPRHDVHAEAAAPRRGVHAARPLGASARSRLLPGMDDDSAGVPFDALPGYGYPEGRLASQSAGAPVRSAPRGAPTSAPAVGELQWWDASAGPQREPPRRVDAWDQPPRVDAWDQPPPHVCDPCAFASAPPPPQHTSSIPPEPLRQPPQPWTPERAAAAAVAPTSRPREAQRRSASARQPPRVPTDWMPRTYGAFAPLRSAGSRGTRGSYDDTESHATSCASQEPPPSALSSRHSFGQLWGRASTPAASEASAAGMGGCARCMHCGQHGGNAATASSLASVDTRATADEQCTPSPGLPESVCLRTSSEGVETGVDWPGREQEARRPSTSHGQLSLDATPHSLDATASPMEEARRPSTMSTSLHSLDATASSCSVSEDEPTPAKPPRGGEPPAPSPTRTPGSTGGRTPRRTTSPPADAVPRRVARRVGKPKAVPVTPRGEPVRPAPVTPRARAAKAEHGAAAARRKSPPRAAELREKEKEKVKPPAPAQAAARVKTGRRTPPLREGVATPRRPVSAIPRANATPRRSSPGPRAVAPSSVKKPRTPGGASGTFASPSPLPPRRAAPPPSPSTPSPAALKKAVRKGAKPSPAVKQAASPAAPMDPPRPRKKVVKKKASAKGPKAVDAPAVVVLSPRPSAIRTSSPEPQMAALEYDTDSSAATTSSATFESTHTEVASDDCHLRMETFRNTQRAVRISEHNRSLLDLQYHASRTQGAREDLRSRDTTTPRRVAFANDEAAPLVMNYPAVNITYHQ